MVTIILCFDVAGIRDQFLGRKILKVMVCRIHSKTSKCSRNNVDISADSIRKKHFFLFQLMSHGYTGKSLRAIQRWKTTVTSVAFNQYHACGKRSENMFTS